MKYATECNNQIHTNAYVEVVLKEQNRYVTEVKPIEGPVHLQVGHKIRGEKSWPVNSHIDLERYYYVY